MNLRELNRPGVKRGTVLALMGGTPHLSETKLICCHCQKVMREGSEPASHGLCAEGLAIALAEIGTIEGGPH